MKASDECSDFLSLYIYDNNDINKEKTITIIIIIKVIIIIIVPVISMRNKGRAHRKRCVSSRCSSARKRKRQERVS